MTNRTRVYTFNAVGWDKFAAHEGTPEDGTRVVKVQPHGCPRNGTNGHCYVAHADTGEFYGLVLVGSLTATKEMVMKPLTGAERARAERDAKNDERFARLAAQRGQR